MYYPILRSRNWDPRKSPAKRVLWGEDEQGSERNFRRQAEMELSGLCEDEGSGGTGAWNESAPLALEVPPRLTPGAFLEKRKEKHFQNK